MNALTISMISLLMGVSLATPSHAAPLSEAAAYKKATFQKKVTGHKQIQNRTKITPEAPALNEPPFPVTNAKVVISREFYNTASEPQYYLMRGPLDTTSYARLREFVSYASNPALPEHWTIAILAPQGGVIELHYYNPDTNFTEVNNKFREFFGIPCVPTTNFTCTHEAIYQ